MRTTKLLWIFPVLILFVLSACGGAKATPTPLNPDAVYTAAFRTAYAAISQTAAAAVTEPPTFTPPPSETPTLGPSKTPLITDTPLVANTPTPTKQQPCDDASFVADKTIPDFSEIAPGVQFVKTWTIKNTGICAWTTRYRLAFSYGGDKTTWKTVQPAYLTREVNPGEEVDVSVTLTAPVASGQYGAHFKMQNNNGYNFGVDLTIIINISGTPTP
jgi:hypothetical protein